MSPCFLKANSGQSVWSLSRQQPFKERSCSWWLQRRGEQQQRGVPFMFSLQMAPLRSSWKIEGDGKTGGEITKTKASCWIRGGEGGSPLWLNRRFYVVGCVQFFFKNNHFQTLKNKIWCHTLSPITKLFMASLTEFFMVETESLELHQTLKVFHVHLQ